MGKVSEELNRAIEGFLESAGEFSAHTANKENPHQVTKNQIGLKNVLNIEQAGKTEFYSHVNSRTNPHSVTKAQVGLSNVTNDKQATEANLNAHTANVNNPHAVTKTQVGLGNVVNAEQATKAEYNAHVADTADKHAVTGITYDATRNLKQFLDDLQLGSGAGTMDHSLLVNRDLAGAHPVSAISGVEDLIGHIYTFLGTTEDDTEIEIFTRDTGTYIDDNGRIKIPVGTALAFEINVICGVQGLGRILVASFGKQSGVLMRTINMGVQLLTNEVEYVTGEVLEGATFGLIPDIASSAEGDGGMKLLVKGTGDSLLWKAVVKIIPLSIGEFGE
jgi:hypothetical protein